MADLLIRGASEYATIIVTLGKAYDAVSGEDYELVLLPTHGRLIDADALSYQLAKHESVDRQPRAIRRAGRIVANAPTVIEASEDGEQDGKL